MRSLPNCATRFSVRDRALDLAARGCFGGRYAQSRATIVFVNTTLARRIGRSVEAVLGCSAVLENFGEFRQSCDVRIGPDVLLNDV